MDRRLRKTLIISDNLKLCEALRNIAARQGLCEFLDFRCSPNSPEYVKSLPYIRPIDLKNLPPNLLDSYELVISAHCKQLFPKSVYARVECLNIHPGYNPETRGWYPQVFGLLKGLRVGLTVHRIDAMLDHGPIVYRQEVHAQNWDTSRTLYCRIVDSEIQYLEMNLRKLLAGTYECNPMEHEGSVFLRRDFEEVCLIDLEEKGSFRDFYNRLRALSFEGFNNAYFIDEASGKKVYLELRISPDEPQAQPSER